MGRGRASEDAKRLQEFINAVRAVLRLDPLYCKYKKRDRKWHPNPEWLNTDGRAPLRNANSRAKVLARW